jgi:hypothetical protein
MIKFLPRCPFEGGTKGYDTLKAHALRCRYALEDFIFLGADITYRRQLVRHEAAREMREGPSNPAYRSRLQTTLSCSGKKPGS